MKITVHCVVKNEDQWIWFAVKSVLSFAQEIFVFDTGSTDKTVEVIESLRSDKIIFEEKGEVDKEELVKLRQEQLNRTKADWFLILDGDEIWSRYQLEKLLNAAQSAPKNVVSVFNRVRNCIGDIYHYLPDNSGAYEIAGKSGHLNIRLIRRSKNLKVFGRYPLEYYADDNGPIQKQVGNLLYSDSWFLHTTFLKRSSTDFKKTSGSFGKKRLPEKGLVTPTEQLPEVFKLDRPDIVEDPSRKRGLIYELAANVTTPLLNLKRKL